MATISTLISLLLVIGTAPGAMGQTSDEERTTRFELRLQGYHFDNFFQAGDSALEEDIQAGGAELRLATRLSRVHPVDAYVRGNYLVYDDDRLDRTWGGRVGLQQNGRVHSFDAHVDRQLDRPTFDVGDQFARADIATFSGSYSNRFHPSWQFGVNGLHSDESFELAPEKDSDFTAGGATLRYRGFGSAFSPEIGFLAGDRNVVDPNEDYRQNDYVLQIRSAPVRPLYLSLRYRHRERDYRIDDPDARNFGRDDERRQWALTAELATGSVVRWTLYATHEDVDSTRPSRDFDTSLILLGITFGW